jgi:hypothetical protein
MLLDAHRFGEAEPAFLDLLREAPGNAGLLALYAQLMLFTANVEKASALVTEALRHEPDHRNARLVAVLVAIVSGKARTGGEQLADLVRQDPECERTARTLLLVLVEQHRHREALLVGQQLLRARPGDRGLVDMVIELRAHTHWVALPAWPLTRWGWAGAVGTWGVAILALGQLKRVSSTWAAILGVAYLVYVIYSWTHGPVLRRWLAWRGV